MREHLTASLERLKTDYADIYYLHRINPDIPVEDVAEVMGKLICEGLIRGWGLSQIDVDVINRAHKVTPLSAVQNIYSMLERGVEEEVAALEDALAQITVYGHRGFVEQQGSSMKEWNRK